MGQNWSWRSPPPPLTLYFPRSPPAFPPPTHTHTGEFLKWEPTANAFGVCRCFQGPQKLSFLCFSPWDPGWAQEWRIYQESYLQIQENSLSLLQLPYPHLHLVFPPSENVGCK